MNNNLKNLAHQEKDKTLTNNLFNAQQKSYFRILN